MHRNSHDDWYALCVTEASYRYFNGRKYYVSKQLRHYVYPAMPDRNFTDRTVCVLLGGRLTRFSRVTVHPPRSYAPPF